jgi:sulfur relay (sulfurtransferase) DsrF/TusC family protein
MSILFHVVMDLEVTNCKYTLLKFFLRFKIYKLIEGNGQRDLCLPPYHCNLTPLNLFGTELIYVTTATLIKMGLK